MTTCYAHNWGHALRWHLRKSPGLSGFLANWHSIDHLHFLSVSVLIFRILLQFLVPLQNFLLTFHILYNLVPVSIIKWTFLSQRCIWWPWSIGWQSKGFRPQILKFGCRPRVPLPPINGEKSRTTKASSTFNIKHNMNETRTLPVQRCEWIKIPTTFATITVRMVQGSLFVAKASRP